VLILAYIPAYKTRELWGSHGSFVPITHVVVGQRARRTLGAQRPVRTPQGTTIGAATARRALGRYRGGNDGPCAACLRADLTHSASALRSAAPGRRRVDCTRHRADAAPISGPRRTLESATIGAVESATIGAVHSACVLPIRTGPLPCATHRRWFTPPYTWTGHPSRARRDPPRADRIDPRSR